MNYIPIAINAECALISVFNMQLHDTTYNPYSTQNVIGMCVRHEKIVYSGDIQLSLLEDMDYAVASACVDEKTSDTGIEHETFVIAVCRKRTACAQHEQKGSMLCHRVFHKIC